MAVILESMPELYWCKKCKREKSEDCFCKYGDGRLRNLCKSCDSARSQEYKTKKRTDPETAAEFKAKESAYNREWRSRPGNSEKQRKYRSDWYNRNKDSPTINVSRMEWAKRNPERVKELQRGYYKKLMEDPERHQRFLEDRRIQYRLRKERKGETASPGSERTRFPERHLMVSVEPFKKWLLPLLRSGDFTIREVAEASGLDQSGLTRIVYDRYKVMDIATADKVLTALKGPPLVSLYPDV